MAQQSRGAADQSAARARLRTLVAPLVDRAGLELEELSVSRAGRRLVVRVVLDCDGGVSHDQLSDVSREISDRLDEAEAAGEEISPDSYTLEVSSPGVDRPLTQLRHWRRNIGRLVTVRVGGRPRTARVATVGDDTITLSGDGLEEIVPFDRLGPGRVQVEFSRPGAAADQPDTTAQEAAHEWEEQP